ncbi:MAG: hypothetical protein IPK73_30920 [Candidatus Obscuribacter sp.]|nr:hypothetical protein [Candidatus Obscuribacter sp.]
MDAWNGLGERVLKTITKGREVVLSAGWPLSHYNKEINGVTVQMTKPVIKLTSFHLCGKKPSTGSNLKPKDRTPKPNGSLQSKVN